MDLILLRQLHPAHFLESGDVCHKDAEVNGISQDTDDTEVIEYEVQDVGEPNGTAVGHDGRR